MQIQAEGKFTTTDVWRGSRLAARKLLIIISLLGLLILAFATFLSFGDEDGWRGQLIFFGLGLFLTVYVWLLLFYKASRQTKKSPNLQGIVRYKFDDEGFGFQALHSQAEIKWAALVKWKEGKHCFLIYTSPSLGNIIPKRFFQSATDVDTVRGFLQAAKR